MRILHTGDWHVGKTLAGRDRSEEHEAVLAEIITIARDRRVDLTLLAGDLFDSASPTPGAERIVFNALLELGRVAPVVVVPGNHDNERRLSALAPLFTLAEVTIIPSIRPECITIDIGAEKATIAALPWLSQRHVVKAEQLMAKDAGELATQYSDRMARIVSSLTAQFEDDAVNLCIGHMTIAGAQLGGGERTAQTIFDYYVASNVFPTNCHYVALGHIHKMQAMSGPCPIRYCGAPLHLDFSDTIDDRGVLVVDAVAGKPATAEIVVLQSGRRLRTLRGTLSELSSFGESSGDEYLRVFVREKARIGLADAVRELLPNAVKVIVEATGDERSQQRPERKGLSPRELFAQYLHEKEIEDPPLVALFDEVYEEMHATAST